MASSESIDLLIARLPHIIEEAGHSQLFSVDLSHDQVSPPTKLVLAKYLKARNGNVEQAAEALTKTLKWNKEFHPRAAAFDERFGDDYEDLAFVTRIGEQVVVWNLYEKASQNASKVFQPLDTYLRWRVGVQERAVALLELNDYTGDGSLDEAYRAKQGVQVHDYANVSLLRLDPAIRAASKALIPLMSDHYAETMKRTYFVNIPFYLRWLFSAISTMLSAETLAKLKVLSSSQELAKELGDIESIPKQYGGTSGMSLKEMEKATMEAWQGKQTKKEVVKDVL